MLNVEIIFFEFCRRIEGYASFENAFSAMEKNLATGHLEMRGSWLEIAIVKQDSHYLKL
jgi:hypothetical protein